MSSSQYLTSNETLKRLPFGKTKFWKDIASGDFPEPIRIGSRCYWLQSQVDEYLAKLEKAAAERQEAKRIARTVSSN
jgi:predicted DNA-binding transcriptional regulator AlpA